ncbi:hypothetical protein BH09MYX1_BH09MYX1_27680 [soil metagenome]
MLLPTIEVDSGPHAAWQMGHGQRHFRLEEGHWGTIHNGHRCVATASTYECTESLLPKRYELIVSARMGIAIHSLDDDTLSVASNFLATLEPIGKTDGFHSDGPHQDAAIVRLDGGKMALITIDTLDPIELPRELQTGRPSVQATTPKMALVFGSYDDVTDSQKTGANHIFIYDVASHRWSSLGPVNARGIFVRETPDGYDVRARGEKDAPCAFAVSSEGTKQPCAKESTGLRSRIGDGRDPQDLTFQDVAIDRWGALSGARFIGNDTFVMPGGMDDRTEGLYRFRMADNSPGVIVEKLVDPARTHCVAVSQEEPLFGCTTDGELRLIRVATDGKVALVREGFVHDAHVFSSIDGGLAVSGTCEGGALEAVCVRQADGTWKTVAFSPELKAALTRTAPSTFLIPNAWGGVLATVATGNLLEGNVRVVGYKVDGGKLFEIEKVPSWITSASMGSLESLLGHGAASAALPLLWRDQATIGVWPLSRKHPALGNDEACRLDVPFHGEYQIECIAGRISSAGRYGLWEKKPGELWETSDAGETWSKIFLPKGVPTDSFECHALGCAIGIYTRIGWGQ